MRRAETRRSVARGTGVLQARRLGSSSGTTRRVLWGSVQFETRNGPVAHVTIGPFEHAPSGEGPFSAIDTAMGGSLSLASPSNDICRIRSGQG
jgi:hypothetical protein